MLLESDVEEGITKIISHGIHHLEVYDGPTQLSEGVADKGQKRWTRRTPSFENK
jgi:hypothetical protein